MKASEVNIIIKKWRLFFKSKGISEENISAYLQYVEHLIKQDMPPIFDFTHLCQLCGVDSSFLAAIINSSSSFYRSFEIPKRNGGKREITAPYPSLKYLQTWIYKNIISKQDVHGCAHGFIPNKSTITNVQVHQGQQCLLKFDLKDFFPSIPINWVIEMFSSFGYTPEVSFYLASICCYEGVLPQGSPASPYVSNIIAKHLDRRLYRLGKKFGFRYSRYADDIAFSGDDIPASFIPYVSEIITDCGFIVNEKKIRLYKGHSRKILTGITLMDEGLRLPREYRRQLEKEFHYIQTYGIIGHMNHCHIRKHNYLESLIGKVGYWLMIEPENVLARRMQAYLMSESDKKNINK